MRRSVLAVVGLVFLLCLLAALGSARAAGATYTVNTTSYTNDGSCDALTGTTDCTLWEAILAAEVEPLIDTVAFNIPITDTNYSYNTAGVWTIVPTETLPSLYQTIVDGTTQATNVLSDTNPYGPEIEISGEGQLSGSYCWIIGSDNTIKGLAINRCQQYGLGVTGDDNTIIGNYMGTDATGSVDVSPTSDGIVLAMDAKNNVIGGDSSGERNIISAMGGGIRVSSAGSTGNVIEGNYIGTDRTGTMALGNGTGIKIHNGAHDNTIGPNNVIAYNSGDGVQVDGSNTDGNTITHNSIHSNGDLGIDLTNGGNDLFPAPVISVNIRTSASGTAPNNATVELFTGPDEEGKTYLTTVSADGSGNWSASGFLADDTYLTATATDAAGNTSEFSTAVAGLDRRAYAPLVMNNH
ncbi:MAG: right-handed parallel beta-helix repeat-containing protein [Anaerolineae bacterium]